MRGREYLRTCRVHVQLPSFGKRALASFTFCSMNKYDARRYFIVKIFYLFI